MEPTRTVLAAGAVVWRRVGDSVELLVVHRPKYGDWSFPKGKTNRGERLPATAAREVLEETSVPIRLGLPLTTVRYPLHRPRPVTKQVSYWVARPIGDGEITLEPNHEIDEARWLRLENAARRLTYEHDRDLLDRFVRLQKTKDHKTRTLVVLRHATARSRTRWKGDDRRRTLTATGLREAHRLVPLLAAYGVSEIVSSDSARCVQSIEPYADHLNADIVLEPGITEEKSSPSRVVECLRSVCATKQPAVLCTHRPVLPMIFEALEIAPIPLEPAQLMVVHHRGRKVLATELHHA